MEVRKIAVLFRGDPKGITNPQMILPQHLEMVRTAAPQAEIFFAETEEDLLSKTDDADVLLTWGTYKPVAFCKQAKSLKWIHVLSAGIDGMLSSEIGGMDLKMTTTKGGIGDCMADHAVAMVYSFLRNTPRLFRQQQNHVWQKFVEGEEIAYKTVGILGLGAIGTLMAKKFKALGARVTAYKRTPADLPYIDKLYTAPNLDEFISEADYLILVCPLTDETRNLICERTLKLMKKDAYLLNFARGGIVDETALIRALREREIAGACLDTFSAEPLPTDHPFWDMDNVLISPHMSAHSPHFMERGFAVFCENLRLFEADQPLKNELNRNLGY